MLSRYTLVAMIGANAMLGGCARDATALGEKPPATRERIAISVGACFGFCPVYTVSVSPDGEVHFSGERHTALLGDRDRRSSVAAYTALARDLAPFRPADGTTAAVECEAAISDTSRYTITWTGPDGRETVATHQRGCSAGPGRALDAVLMKLPEQLGIAAWAKQTTRPGVSRG